MALIERRYDLRRVEDALLHLAGFSESPHGWHAPEDGTVYEDRGAAVEEACARVELGDVHEDDVFLEPMPDNREV